MSSCHGLFWLDCMHACNGGNILPVWMNRYSNESVGGAIKLLERVANHTHTHTLKTVVSVQKLGRIISWNHLEKKKEKWCRGGG